MSKFRKPKFVTDQTYVAEIDYDKSKISKLFTEAENLNIYNLKKISLTDKIPLDVSIEDGSNLIHHILKKPSNSQNQKINLIKFLVENNVNPDKTDKNNNTPLHLACENQEDIIIKYLLEIGCNPNFKNNLGMTPFHYYLAGIYKEKILERDFLSIVKVKDPLELEQQQLDLNLNLIINNDNELKTLENTIDYFLSDKKINQSLDKIKVNSEFDLIQVKGFLEKKIDNYFKNAFNFEDLEIHEKNINSLPTNHPSLSILQNINTNKILKDNIRKNINDIIDVIEPLVINVPNLRRLDLDDFMTINLNDEFRIDTTGGNIVHFYEDKYLFFTNIPNNDFEINNLMIVDRINYIKINNPNSNLEDTYIENQASKILYLSTYPVILEILTRNIEDKERLKEALKLWLFILMDEGRTEYLVNKYETIKNVNEEVILMNNLIDEYIDNDFNYDARIKIFDKLIEQKNTRVFYNNLLFRDTLFILKKVRSAVELQYYFSVISDINNIRDDYKGIRNYMDLNNLSSKIQDLLPSINLEVLISNQNDIYKMHNYAYFYDVELLTVNNVDYPLDRDNITARINLSIVNSLRIYDNFIDTFKKLFSENGIKNYGKIAPVYLTTISYFNYHYGKLLRFIRKNLDITNSNISILEPKIINGIIDKMNFINGNYYLYYYFNTEDGKKLRLPKFYLYKIPKLENEKDKLELTGNLVFDKDNEELLMLDNFGIKVEGSDDETVINDNDIKYINSLYNFSDDSDIYSIYIAYDVKDDFYKRERLSSLPPSLMDNQFIKIFIDIYLKNKMKNLNYDNLINLIKYKNKIPESEKEILDKKTIGLKLKELLINKKNDIINQKINAKLIELYTGILGQEILESISVKSNYKINLNEINLKYKSMTNILPYYEYDLKPEENKSFLIYSDDYSSTQIEKSLLESIINELGLKYLIENGASISIEDNYGKNPLENIIKNLNVDIYKKVLDLLKFNVDLNTINNKKILDYFINALHSEIDKYLNNNKLNIVQSIIKFSLDQANDIDIKVKTISPQLNNKYYKLSYKIVNYLSNQLISIMNLIYNNSQNINNKDNLFELINLNPNDINILNISNISGFENNESLLLNNLRNNLLVEARNIKNQIKKLENIGKDTTNLENKKLELTNIIRKLRKQSKSSRYDYNLGIIDLDFIDKYGRIDNLVELEMFNDLFNTNLEDDNLIILPRLLIKEKEYLDNLNVENWKKYLEISKFYSKLADEMELYFTGNQFRDNNELKQFSFKVLVYLTKTVIISQIELLIRKVLIEYFDNTYPLSAPNIARVDGILYNNTFTGNINSNKDKLYNLAEKMVINSVYIYKNQNEKESFVEKSIENLLEEWLLEMIRNSMTSINEDDEFISKLRIQLNNFGFIKNIINNWLVVIENNFKFIINHSRLLKMLELTIINI